MKPDPAAPADPLNLLRQQLILAQVRIMELEDLRDSQAPRITELERFLQSAQNLADQKIDESAHLEKILADLQAHCDRLNHALKLTDQALGATRTTLTETATCLNQRDETVSRLESAVKQKEGELRALHASRSWRWTAWLRPRDGKTDDGQP